MHGFERQLARLMMRFVRGMRDHVHPRRAGGESEDGIDLRVGAIFVLRALNDRDGAVHITNGFAEIPGIEGRRQPCACPIPEKLFSVGKVVFAKFVAHAGGVGVDGGADALPGDVFDEDVRGFGEDAAGLWDAVHGGVEEGDGGSVAVADEDEVVDGFVREEMMQGFGFAMHVEGRAGRGAGGGTAVPAAIVEEGGQPGGGAELCREIAPLAGAAESVMEENEDGLVMCCCNAFDVQ